LPAPHNHSTEPTLKAEHTCEFIFAGGKMPKVFRTENLQFKKIEPRLPEFIWNTSPRFAKLADSKHLEFDIRSLDPGRFSFPYHFHRAAEELFYIISGEVTLRSPEGFQKIARGDLIFFEEGPLGAHQLYNHSDSPCVYLDIRTKFGIDVCEYPDSGKINILPFHEVFESNSKEDYYKGEEQVTSKWPQEMIRKPSER
jgi:uncharacterized cupin superfamily protein